MALADNIKRIRETLNLKQIEVANYINVDKSAYSKIEKGARALTIEELIKLTKLFNMSADEIINYDENFMPKEVVMEDKAPNEQALLLEELEEKDRATVMAMIETMLTKKKFKDFFNKNVATL